MLRRLNGRCLSATRADSRQVNPASPAKPRDRPFLHYVLRTDRNQPPIAFVIALFTQRLGQGFAESTGFVTAVHVLARRAAGTSA